MNGHKTLLYGSDTRGDFMKGEAFFRERTSHLVSRSLHSNGLATDFGVTLNASSPAAPFSHGLKGVDQGLNWTSVDALSASILALLLVTLVYRAVQITNSYLRKVFTLDQGSDQSHWRYNQSCLWPWIKKHLIYAPLFRHRHNREIQLSKAVSIGTLPSRYQTILLVAYIISNFAYLLAQDWHRDKIASVIAELRGRAGILAAFNLVPTVLFALRNNPLIPLLGVSYDTFNLLHRWCARVVVFEAVLHTICWAVNALRSGGARNVSLVLATSTSYRWGMVATSMFGCILLTSLSPVRHAFYETFLNVHRLLVFVALLGAYIHIDWANLPQAPYIRLACAAWAFEWVWRVTRIYYYGYSWRHGCTKVTIEALPAEACRVTFHLKSSWTWSPGCHAHAYLPVFALWSSHPFSVAWVESERRTLLPEYEPLENPLPPLPHLLQTTTELSDQGCECDFAESPRTWNSLSEHNATSTISTSKGAPHKPPGSTFAATKHKNITEVSLIVRARTGMTRSIYNKAAASATGVITTWGALEGPYGGGPQSVLTSYGTVVLFAGGVGITHCLGYIRHLLLQHAAGVTPIRRILLVWTVPASEALEWVREWMDTILRLRNRRELLRVQIFITRPKRRDEVVSGSGSVQMFPGRCNVDAIVERETKDRIGAMAVMVCGPGVFADAVRAAVRGVVEVGSVDFMEEAFTY